MTRYSNKRIRKRALIMAGGTGGHIFPALAVARELQSRDWNIFWLGSRNGMEEDIIGKTDIPLNLINVVGLRGNGILGWFKAPFLILKSVIESMIIIKNIQPNVVVGFGGFASGPGGIASFLMRVKLMIHEQNAIAGMTNRYLSKVASKVYLGFPNAFGKVENKKYKTVGNPIRAEIKDIKKVVKTKDKNNSKTINLLILGGSRGARAINQRIPNLIRSMNDENLICVVHQSGKGNFEETSEQYSDYQGSFEVIEFIENMQERLAWADVVICRAGASTVAEIAAVGLAAIFIPFPYAVDDHQFFNGSWLADKGAAEIIRENELDSVDAIQKISNLLSSTNKIEKLGNLAKELAYLNAAEEIANDCENLVIEKLRAA